MQSIKQVQRLNERELEKAVPPSASWHTDYRDTAYIYVGGLPFELSEGDVITIFSQYGDPVWIKLARDKDSGKSRGFAWLKYEDQRSCDLAVDNLSGASVMGRMLAVDHARYKKRDDEDEKEGYVGQDRRVEGTGGGESERGPRRSHRRSRSRSESGLEEKPRPMIKEELELERLLQDHDEEDPMKAYMVEQKKEEIQEVLKAKGRLESKDERSKHRSHRSHRHDDNDERRARRHTRRPSHDDPTRQRRSGRHEDRRRRSSTRSRSPSAHASPRPKTTRPNDARSTRRGERSYSRSKSPRRRHRERSSTPRRRP